MADEEFNLPPEGGSHFNECDADPIIETDPLKEEARKKIKDKSSKHQKKTMDKFMETYLGCGCVTVGCFLPSLLLASAVATGLFVVVWKVIK